MPESSTGQGRAMRVASGMPRPAVGVTGVRVAARADSTSPAALVDVKKTDPRRATVQRFARRSRSFAESLRKGEVTAYTTYPDNACLDTECYVLALKESRRAEIGQGAGGGWSRRLMRRIRIFVRRRRRSCPRTSLANS